MNIRKYLKRCANKKVKQDKTEARLKPMSKHCKVSTNQKEDEKEKTSFDQ
jgi:hypothetical protein